MSQLFQLEIIRKMSGTTYPLATRIGFVNIVIVTVDTLIHAVVAAVASLVDEAPDKGMHKGEVVVIQAVGEHLRKIIQDTVGEHPRKTFQD